MIVEPVAVSRFDQQVVGFILGRRIVQDWLVVAPDISRKNYFDRSVVRLGQLDFDEAGPEYVAGGDEPRADEFVQPYVLFI